MPNMKERLAGPGCTILNVIRVMNIIGLLAVIAASIVMLVKTFIVSKFFFFDGVSHIITAGLSAFLLISELPLFRAYYARNWPLLSPTSGFVTLGFLMITVGVSTLGNLNKQATSETSLGRAFWRIVISSGIVVLVLGPINILANYIFRDSARGVTARMVRIHGSQAKYKLALEEHMKSSSARSPILSRLSRHPKTPPAYDPPRRQPSKGGNPNISSPINADKTQFAKFNTDVEIGRPEGVVHPAYRF